MSYLKRHGTRRTPQWAPIPGSGQVPNSARRLRLGGRRLDAAAPLPDPRLRGRQLLRARADAHAGERPGASSAASPSRRPRTVAEIVAVSGEGRAPKNDPAIFALALAAGLGDEPTRRSALEALPEVCRTGTHLFQFAAFVEGFRGWGRSLRRGVGRWYAGPVAGGARLPGGQVPPARSVTHRDLLRLAHPAGR